MLKQRQEQQLQQAQPQRQAQGQGQISDSGSRSRSQPIVPIRGSHQDVIQRISQEQMTKLIDAVDQLPQMADMIRRLEAVSGKMLRSSQTQVTEAVE